MNVYSLTYNSFEERDTMKAKSVVPVFIVFSTCMMLFLSASLGFSQEKGRVHTVKKGDTLWDLSSQYLGDPQKWPEIWEENRFIGNPNYIYPGLKIVISPPGTLREEFEITEGKKRAMEKEMMREVLEEKTKRALTLQLSHDEALSSGELIIGKPEKVGEMIETTEAKVIFSPGDRVYLSLDKEYPKGTHLGIFRVDGPVYIPGVGRKGYKHKFIGKIRIEGKFGGRFVGTVLGLFKEAMRSDYLEEKIPTAPPVTPKYEKDGKRGEIVCASGENYEFSEGNVLYIKGGSKGGFENGDMLNIYVPLRSLQKLTVSGETKGLSAKGDLVHVGRGIIIRTNENFSSLFVLDSETSFNVPALVVRGEV